MAENTVLMSAYLRGRVCVMSTGSTAYCRELLPSAHPEVINHGTNRLAYQEAIKLLK